MNRRNFLQSIGVCAGLMVMPNIIGQLGNNESFYARKYMNPYTFQPSYAFFFKDDNTMTKTLLFDIPSDSVNEIKEFNQSIDIEQNVLNYLEYSQQKYWENHNKNVPNDNIKLLPKLFNEIKDNGFDIDKLIV